MTPVRRAVGYFRHDRRLIGGLVLLVALSLGVSLLAVWPVGIAIDVVFNRKEASTFFHRLFLGPLPESPLGQLIGLTLISFVLVIAQEGAWFLRQLINYRLRLNGLARVRTDLYTIRSTCLMRGTLPSTGRMRSCWRSAGNTTRWSRRSATRSIKRHSVVSMC